MGDSDEEHDRRRGRDKFRGERNDYDNVNRRPMSHHRGGYDRGGRGPPPDRRGGGGRDFHRPQKRDYYSRDREMAGRGSSPPVKRARDNNFNADHGSWRGGPQETPTGDTNSPAPGGTVAPSLPAVMSFKEFVIKQEDDIDEQEALRRYQEYKTEFKRTQINDFFVLHKDEEWFKEKYHPKDSVTRNQEIRLSLKNRCRTFIELLDNGYVERVSLEISNAEEVLKFLDRILVKLEGGTDKEVEDLDLPSEESNHDQVKKDESVASNHEPAEAESDELTVKPNPEYKYDVDEGVGSEGEAEPAPPGADDETMAPPGIEAGDEKKETKEEMQTDDEEEEEVNINILHRGSLSFLFTDNHESKPAEDSEEKKADDKHDASVKSDESSNNADVPQSDIKMGYDGSRIKRPLSLFMRNLPPSITRQDLHDVCKRYPGFVRVCMGDPQPERRFYRFGWATFDHTVNIKDICWNLSNIRIKDNDLSPGVNKEVINRVRPVTGLTYANMAMQLDLNLATRVVRRLDAKHKLYVQEESNGVNGEETKQEGDETEIVSLPLENPVLATLFDGIEKLVDCDIVDEKDGTEERKLIHNKMLAKTLDKVLIYLRIVHYIDYYNGCNIPSEDEMPSRCGIIHVRDTAPETVTKQSILDWHKSNAEKIEVLAPDESFATEEEAKKLGLKDDEVEVNNFVKANTQELAKDKWLCPLSGKKFRGPDFIRKHIFNKHMDSVDNVKAEVVYFNNYVRDLRRPCFPDLKPRSVTSTNQTPATATTPIISHTPSPGARNWSPRQQPPVFASPRPPYTPQYQPTNAHGSDSYGRINTYPPRPVRRDQPRRPVIKYKDLDAPDEGDFF